MEEEVKHLTDLFAEADQLVEQFTRGHEELQKESAESMARYLERYGQQLNSEDVEDDN